jgi:hypothetical protein
MTVLIDRRSPFADHQAAILAERGLTFPLLLDPGCRGADASGAETTFCRGGLACLASLETVMQGEEAR